MNKPTKVIPKFDTEAQERAYWETHDSTEHLDWTKGQKRHAAEPETHHPDDLTAPAAAFAGLHQGGCECPRCAVPVADQGLAAGKAAQPLKNGRDRWSRACPRQTLMATVFHKYVTGPQPCPFQAALSRRPPAPAP
jgi:hypothetical protein